MIFSTLFQALKAIGGGVLALKGQLVKGSGYLLAGKGKVVSKAGDVITSFGKSLAANAQSKPDPPETYYGHPPVQHSKIQSLPSRICRVFRCRYYDNERSIRKLLKNSIAYTYTRKLQTLHTKVLKT